MADKTKAARNLNIVLFFIDWAGPEKIWLADNNQPAAEY
jgi:hypothetical protein